ncbi:MAG: helix-turn-helix transcriptional regulator [Oscillospiraceae bacterium]|nr:helix-turn-helix transcriptional regulator [Oscillospiraceae bacterium]
MKPRKAEYGNKNICGANVERIRKEQGMKQATLVAKMQLAGVDINPSSLSKLEGQIRVASDIELKAIAAILDVSMEELVRAESDEVKSE